MNWTKAKILLNWVEHWLYQRVLQCSFLNALILIFLYF